LDGSDIDAIFVTHEHSDHVSGIGVLSRRYDIPVYATEGTWENMPQSIGNIKPIMQNAVYSGEDCIFNDILIRPFEIPHDARQPVGYTIETGNKKIAVATDIGHITNTIKENIADANLLLLESNHDVEMVMSGPYTYSLKQRILSEYGHLSNKNAGLLLKDVINSSDSKLDYVFLGHLSKDNNYPDLAYNTVSDILTQDGIHIDKDVNLWVNSPYGVEKIIEL
jgi:phosphoribosyl 1,2-cyclic phosphodiesterase